MSTLSNLLRQIEQKDPQLAADVEREVKALQSRRAFGLNFERHVPESVELPGRPIRRGDKVRFLPERGQPANSVDKRLWRVAAIHKTANGKVADLARQADPDAEPEIATRACADLVVVAEFRDPIYPGLRSTGRIERGGDKPCHTVINAENYHALQALLYTHEGKVDAIYIDPPYNTGAKDWKYNNDYVDGDDAYRHSKWLAMMERRLKLAKRLLNPDNSVLIVTIDEKEYLRLGLLLQQIFPGEEIQKVTSVINPKGTPKRDYFARVEEYLYFVYVGDAVPAKTKVRMLSGEEKTEAKPVRWASLQRSGGQSLREDTEVKFYPIFIYAETGRIIRVGNHVGPDFDISLIKPKAGELVQWPIKKDGRHGCWQVSDETLREYLAKGRVKVGQRNNKTGQWTLYYLMSSDWKRVQEGDVEILGTDNNGALVKWPPLFGQPENKLSSDMMG